MTPPHGLLVEIDSIPELDAYVRYLARLGCEVEAADPARIRISVAYPETVDDEVEALREWHTTWLRAHPVALAHRA